MGTVAASLIVLGKDWTTGAISTGTFTTEPCICNCPPRGKLYNDMNGILKDINLSSNAYRHSSGGFVGNERPFATASFGILHCLSCTKHVLHNHSLFFSDTLPVKYLFFNSMLTEDNFLLTSTTECENHVWWQHVQTNVGPIAIVSWKCETHSVRFWPYFWACFADISLHLFEGALSNFCSSGFSFVHFASCSDSFCFFVRFFLFSFSAVLNSGLERFVFK